MTKNPLNTIPASDPEYLRFVAELEARIRTARLSAARAVNCELILLYWDLGRAIAEKQTQFGWGESVVEQLAVDLQKKFPAMTGFSPQNMWRMRQFYLTHTSDEFLSQFVRERGRKENVGRNAEKLSQAVRELVASVPWGHHANVLAKVDDSAARIFYLRATARYGWTRRILLNQIKTGAYERLRGDDKRHNFARTLPAHFAEQAEEALKSSYNLEFLGIRREIRERELEDRLVERLREFILELGYGFCFIGRQYRLTLGGKEYFIDLLFYHRFLKALVAFELKIGPFEPAYAGQMDFYLNLLNAKERAPDDCLSIGIILCAEKDNLEVEFALKSKTNPIGVAEYYLQPKLPMEFKGKLPTTKQLTDVLRSILPAKSRV